MPCIVVIEDDLNILTLLGELLEEEGMTCIPLSRPDLLDDLSPTQQVDVFLIDMMLPDVSGLDIAARLRADGYADTPMVALSASQSLLRAAMDTGMFQDSIAKPFDILALLDCLQLHASPARRGDAVSLGQG